MTAQKRKEGDGLPPPEDLGRVTSNLLVEVRTVLSRAQTALYDVGTRVDYDPETKEWVRSLVPEQLWTVKRSEVIWTDPDENGRRRDTGERTARVTAPHPQGAEMVEALRKVVELLEPWARTGR